MKPLARRCPVCDCSHGEVLHRLRFGVFDDYPLPSEYDIAECALCGMVFADTPATAADYERLSLDQDTICRSAPWSDDVTRIVGALPACEFPRILQIGCANGDLLQRIHQAGYVNVSGVDSSAACVANTRAKGIAASRGTLTDLRPQDGPCDLVILYAVLDHVLDLRSALASAASLLGAEGRIFIAVSDAAAYADCLYSPFQDFNSEHINHFGARSLDTLMAQAGFRCLWRQSRVLPGGGGVHHPGLEAVYERGSESTLQPAEGTDAQIRRYIALSRQFMERLSAQVAAAIARSRELLVWGTGHLARHLVRETALAQARIAAWIDTDPIHHGRRLHGVPVLPPEAASGADAPVLIATIPFADEIERRIRAMGWTNEVIRLS